MCISLIFFVFSKELNKTNHLLEYPQDNYIFPN